MQTSGSATRADSRGFPTAYLGKNNKLDQRSIDEINALRAKYGETNNTENVSEWSRKANSMKKVTIDNNDDDQSFVTGALTSTDREARGLDPTPAESFESRGLSWMQGVRQAMGQPMSGTQLLHQTVQERRAAEAAKVEAVVKEAGKPKPITLPADMTLQELIIHVCSLEARIRVLEESCADEFELDPSDMVALANSLYEDYKTSKQPDMTSYIKHVIDNQAILEAILLPAADSEDPDTTGDIWPMIGGIADWLTPGFAHAHAGGMATGLPGLEAAARLQKPKGCTIEYDRSHALAVAGIEAVGPAWAGLLWILKCPKYTFTHPRRYNNLLYDAGSPIRSFPVDESAPKRRLLKASGEARNDTGVNLKAPASWQYSDAGKIALLQYILQVMEKSPGARRAAAEFSKHHYKQLRSASANNSKGRTSMVASGKL